jgi:DNA-directed RNA polymerase specialized sigma subunit
MINCTKCPARAKCTKLCKKMEEYVNQDINPRAWNKIRPSENIEKVQTSKMPDNLSTTEIILQFYFIDRMTPQEIANKLFKSDKYVYKIIKKYSDILKENIQKTAKFG